MSSSSAEAATAWTRRLGPLRERNFALFWSARSLSLIGDYAFRVAFIAYVITATNGSAVALAVANAVLLVPALVFYLLGGVVGDRARSRRRVMIVADMARAAVVAGAMLAVVTHAPLYLVVAFAVAISVGDGFFGPASVAYMADIVPTERLIGANSAISVSQQVGLVAGPMLGGLLVGFGNAALGFGFNALSFAASALLLGLIRRADAPASAPAEGAEPAGGAEPAESGLRRLAADLRGGLSYVAVQRWLLISFLVGALANAVFAGNLDVTVPFVVAPEGVSGAESLGGFYALEGAGAVLGAIILARLVISRPGPLMFSMLALMAAALAAVGGVGRGVGALLLAVVYGVGLHFFNSLFMTVLQQKVPGDLMSRVSSVAFLGFGGLMPLGTLAMGPLVASFGPSNTLIVTGLSVCLLCLAVIMTRSVRDLVLRTEADREPAPSTSGSMEDTLL